MGIPVKKSRLKHLADTPPVYDGLTTVGTIVTGGLGASAAQTSSAAHWILFATFITAASAAGKVRAELAKKERDLGLDGIRGLLQVVYSIVLRDSKPNGSSLRVTLHVPNDTGTLLYQAVDYVGAHGDERCWKGGGRPFASDKGTIGRAFTTIEPDAGQRTGLEHSLYVQWLVENYNYLPEEAANLDSTTMSWLSMPIYSVSLVGGQTIKRVHGVLYLDSTNPGFFSIERQKIVAWAAGGIAYHVAWRYP